MPPKVLLVEPDEESKTSIANAIERYWFNVIRLSDATVAVRSLALHNPHLVILSSRIKDIPFVKLVNEIRQEKDFTSIPMVFILEEADKNPYSEIDNGLIEIIHRPFSHSELMLSIKALFRKSRPELQDRVLKYRDVTIDLGNYKTTRQEQNIHLGPTEFKILQLLIQAPKSIFSRQQIIDYVWGTENNNIDLRTVDVHMNRLRSALKKVSNIPFIQTIRSLGYCLSLPGDPD